MEIPMQLPNLHSILRWFGQAAVLAAFLPPLQASPCTIFHADGWSVFPTCSAIPAVVSGVYFPYPGNGGRASMRVVSLPDELDLIFTFSDPPSSFFINGALSLPDSLTFDALSITLYGSSPASACAFSLTPHSADACVTASVPYNAAPFSPTSDLPFAVEGAGSGLREVVVGFGYRNGPVGPHVDADTETDEPPTVILFLGALLLLLARPRAV